MKGRCIRFAAMLSVLLVTAPYAFAQGGGASQTGTINGKVIDASGGALPGVTVIIASPSMMGTQSQVTNEVGLYRFPAVPPGTYSITYEMGGFNTLKREDIVVSLGFTATVNVELKVASLQETVTVTGDSPVIDTSSNRVQQNFKLDQLQSLPNARDMWSLLAVSPGVSMSRIDVGGNRAGTQTGYTAYGYNGQTRVLVEGINTTEGTSGAGFYFDYGSFEEVFLGTAAQGAEMPTPGVQSQFLGKSGGNKFQGEIYQDYERNSFQGENIQNNLPAKWLYSPTNTSGIRLHSNELVKYRDFNLNIGGPISKDKVWWYFSYRDQKNSVLQPNFLFTPNNFDTRLWNPSGKVTYQANRNNRFVGYYQWGQKIQPNRLPQSTFTYDSPDWTFAQNSGSWVYKGEWNGTVSNRLYVEARYGVFGYYFPLQANSDNDYYWRDSGTSVLFGGDQKEQTDRHRGQLTGAATYFKDRFLGGSHTFKFGGELLYETEYIGYLQSKAGHILHLFNNGSPRQVTFDFPTATNVGGVLSGPHGELLSVDKVNTADAFLSDQYTLGRITFNLGLRFDHYKSFIPGQHQMAFEIFPGCAARTDIICAVPAKDIPGQTFFTWNSVVPRVGFNWDLMGNGKTVLKANYGLYRYNPGPGLAGDANPNQSLKTITYNWNDANSDRHFQIGEQTSLSSTALEGSITIDRKIKQPYTQEFSAFLDREVTQGFAAHVGFVYKTEDNPTTTYVPGRPPSAYTVPFTNTDIGPDGVSGTADDRVLTFFGVPSANAAVLFPVDNRIMNIGTFRRYKNVELSINKRLSHRWSMTAGTGYGWARDYIFPNNPNQFDFIDRRTTGYGFKASGTYEAPYGIRISPIYRFQSGPMYARTISVAAPASCSCIFTGTVDIEPRKARRQDNPSVFDVRAEKMVRLGGTMRVRLFGDVYNILNSYAAETITVASGPSFEKPTAILGPRTARLGFRLQW